MDAHAVDCCPGSVAKLVTAFETIARGYDHASTTGRIFDGSGSHHVVAQHRESFETRGGGAGALGDDHEGSADGRSSRRLLPRERRGPESQRERVRPTGTERHGARATGARRKERGGDTCGVREQSDDGCFSRTPPPRSVSPVSSANSRRSVFFVEVCDNGVVVGGTTTPETASTCLDRPDNRCRVNRSSDCPAGVPTSREARKRQKSTQKSSAVSDEP